MTIDKNKTNRSYLFGRLYGCLLYLEDQFQNMHIINTNNVAKKIKEFESHPAGEFRILYDYIIGEKCEVSE